MKFTQRLAYYLSGFAIGLIILMFFLNGKDASCDYGPNARTTKNITSKKIQLTLVSEKSAKRIGLDSATIKNIIRYGTVDFKKSNTKLDSCNVYHIDNTYKDKAIEVVVKNCDSIAILQSIKSSN
ncbi:hypothetical protein [uncultured Winogradskyella sp.]|uniref:hypothetical protein n=1 Tax=uncultured Winogradskyella sp. TaxID=395353 RepID=UPI002626F58A|nr:hypothetical protein [uncultured Winogradskyella sp.]